ncbi:MAG: hypothetical protein HC890_13540, partial [Chloroflexaceae bacterium]|nr:hypothetical protein [Chloroflexaceae bacterium]
GTGKTRLLEAIVAKAIEDGQWVLVIGHRVRLVEALCQRFGLDYITEIRDNPQERSGATDCALIHSIPNPRPVLQPRVGRMGW